MKSWQVTTCRLLPTCINDDIVDFSWLTYIICRAGYYPNRMREVGYPILFFTPYRRHRLTYVARSSGLTRDLCINRSQSYRGACSHSNANKVKKEVERKRLTLLQKWIELEASMEFCTSFKDYCTTVSRYDNNYSVFKQNKSSASVRKVFWYIFNRI